MGKINVGRGHLPCYYCSNHPKFAIWRLAETSWTPCTASACQLSMEMELALVLGPGSLGVWWSSRCTMAWCSCWYAHSRWCTSSGWRGSQHHQQIFRDPTNLTQHEGQLADPAQCGRVIFVPCLCHLPPQCSCWLNEMSKSIPHVSCLQTGTFKK